MKGFRLVIFACALLLSVPMSGRLQRKVASPDGTLILTAGVNGSGQPFYQLQRGKRTIISPSYLGMKLRDGNLDKDFRILGFTTGTKDETWQQPWGEEVTVRNHYNELTMRLQQRGRQGRQLTLVFRVFNDGIGFRYEFPRQPRLTDFVIMDEETQFAFPFDAKAWTMPTQGTVYYEALWTASPLSSKPEVSTPVTMEAGDSLYMVIHEANLTDYSSLNLQPIASPKGTATVKAQLVPWSTGELVFASTPFVSPWRTVIVAQTPAGLVASRLMLNLNEPCRIKDTSWLETGKYVGIWWGMHMNNMSWAQGSKHGATTENTRRYIDFAAAHGMKGVLVEGWNYGWDGDWTKEGDKFSFTKPYPDYDLQGLQRYAMSKGVRLIAHNETGGAAANYEHQLDSAFSLYHRLGIRAVKTGYVNPKLDNKELQHSQYGVRHYRKVVEKAAQYQLMVVNHEPAMPTGLQRTYPNLISGEGARGQEYNAWSEDGGNPPYHLCVLPFTRILAGPLDFTPGIFRIEGRVHPQTRPQTTLAKQLAAYVVIYAPWQMAADEIENYQGQPAFTFIEQVPTSWQQSQVLMADIGKYIVTARKERDSENWYVGGMTDADARELSVKFDFLDKDAKYQAIVYRDGPAAAYDTNPYPLTIDRLTIDCHTVLPIHLAKSGGFAIQLLKLPLRP
ncbi:glycoside hydrolase family 97 protein [Prevotella sp. kh1p2]|uniref:glycoside hydrolase family 97 protein n=1 Tax=Prevotella sp. kh1p2 TaxID=1761883 RepID=UPI0008D47141|nr:glycoside hydrolase family 97 protein [Prevotella sp. kh1p2]SES83782.1 alpha-glucosidase [Prevotella sp. kh1p2]SNU10791.1 alpha-glucosidase [Prevotellaceae bacterium KH2P17]